MTLPCGVLNSQGLRLWWLHHLSLPLAGHDPHGFATLNAGCLLASVAGTTVCLEIPLQSPSPPGGDHHLATAPPPPPEGETVARYGGRFKGGGAGYQHGIKGWGGCLVMSCNRRGLRGLCIQQVCAYCCIHRGFNLGFVAEDMDVPMVYAMCAQCKDIPNTICHMASKESLVE